MQLSEQNRSCKILIRGREICTTIDDFAKVREDTETDIGPFGLGKGLGRRIEIG